MPILTKQWTDPAEPGDGTRILVCRYRPRGVSKADETWHVWEPSLGPSKALHGAVYTKTASPLSWPMYRRRYLEEMMSSKELIRKLAARVKAGETITLLCSSACDREARCHRSVLKDLIEKAMDDT
jgi:uncharacterized protein YeaO (DUF488 family)